MSVRELHQEACNCADWLTKAEIEAEFRRNPPPRRLSDCANSDTPPDPCPWVRCRWHLFLDVMPSGSLKFNWPGRDLTEIPATCALHEAARYGSLRLGEVGSRLNVCRERIRQIIDQAVERIRARVPGDELERLEQHWR